MENEKKHNPLLVLIILINTIFVIFILIKQFQINDLSNVSSTETSTVTEGSPPTMYNGLTARKEHSFGQIEFKELHANFQKDRGPKRFLKLSFILIVDTPQNNPLAEIQSMKPKLRDGIYSIINNIKSKEALRLEGRSSFKIKLINKINKILKKDKVVRVLFKTFLVK
jgi:flagellar basal body-associated protein FliL